MLPRPKRLVKKKDFMGLATKGRSVFGPIATLRVKASGTQETKVAFITSTKVMKLAVDRNRAKRRMREAVRSVWSELPPAMHLLFVLKPEAKSIPYEDMIAEVKRLIARIPEAMSKPPKPSSRGVKYATKLATPKTAKPS